MGNPSRGITKIASLNVNAAVLEVVGVDLLESYRNLCGQLSSKVNLTHPGGGKSSSALDSNNSTANVLDKLGRFSGKSTVGLHYEWDKLIRSWSVSVMIFFLFDSFISSVKPRPCRVGSTT
jgi:hypothetical protein